MVIGVRAIAHHQSKLTRQSPRTSDATDLQRGEARTQTEIPVLGARRQHAILPAQILRIHPHASIGDDAHGTGDRAGLQQGAHREAGRRGIHAI